jgi:hypothetical protein
VVVCLGSHTLRTRLRTNRILHHRVGTRPRRRRSPQPARPRRLRAPVASACATRTRGGRRATSYDVPIEGVDRCCLDPDEDLIVPDRWAGRCHRVSGHRRDRRCLAWRPSSSALAQVATPRSYDRRPGMGTSRQGDDPPAGVCDVIGIRRRHLVSRRCQAPDRAKAEREGTSRPTALRPRGGAVLQCGRASSDGPATSAPPSTGRTGR